MCVYAKAMAHGESSPPTWGAGASEWWVTKPDKSRCSVLTVGWWRGFPMGATGTDG